MNLPPYNFRNIFIDSTENSRKIFRSNAVDDGDDKSAQWLRESVNIESYIDLRTESEFCPTSKLDKYFIFKTSYDKAEKELESKNKSDNRGYRYSFPLTFLLFNFKTINLINCYYNILEDCKDQFKKIFSVMIDAENFPILISCALGKDRTGVACVILMKLADCSDEIIINEYSKSEECLEPLLAKIKKAIIENEINEEFATSPPEVMRIFLNHFQEKYGKVENYLIECGMNKEDIEQIKKNITS